MRINSTQMIILENKLFEVDEKSFLFSQKFDVSTIWQETIN